MKKYIATIENLNDESTFKAYYDTESGIISTEDGEEIHDMCLRNEEGDVIEAADKELVEAVYGMYNSAPWYISDCIEYQG